MPDIVIVNPVSLPLRTQKIIREVRHTGAWVSEAQRTFRVAPTDRFDAVRFVELVWDGLETAAISRRGSRYSRRSASILAAKRVRPNRRVHD